MDTSMGALPCPPDAMVSVSVIQVRSTPRFASESITTACWGEGNSKTRSDRSAALKVRALLKSHFWNERQKPPTPAGGPPPPAALLLQHSLVCSPRGRGVCAAPPPLG